MKLLTFKQIKTILFFFLPNYTPLAQTINLFYHCKSIGSVFKYFTLLKGNGYSEKTWFPRQIILKKCKSSDDFHVVIFYLRITINSTVWCTGNLPVKSSAYFMERNIYIQPFTHWKYWPRAQRKRGSDLWFSLGNKPGWQASRLSTPRCHDRNFRTKSIHYWDNFKLNEILAGFFGKQRQLQQKDFVRKWEKFLVINSATQEDFGRDNEWVSPCSSLVSSPS